MNGDVPGVTYVSDPITRSVLQDKVIFHFFVNVSVCVFFPTVMFFFRDHQVGNPTASNDFYSSVGIYLAELQFFF